jgi:hypothetical protein
MQIFSKPPESVVLWFAQYRNEDRIKIFAETVQPSITYRRNIASQLNLHRITRRFKQKFAILEIPAYHQLHVWVLLLPVLFAAIRGAGNLLNPI